jgi:NAD(P)-dependent dehydrogenase (short-subunit alcohol dehydrogenase family)
MALLEGKIALVTGCARMNGLGRSIALALAGEGADVIVTDVLESGTRNVLEKSTAEADAGWQGIHSVVKEIHALGRRSVALLGDVGDEHDAERMVRETVKTAGRIDILVNNAGAPHGADRDWSWQVPAGAFDAVLHVNTRGTFLMSTAVVRQMLQRHDQGRGGRIINIASSAGQQGIAQRAAYCASKFAVIGLTQVMALELAPRGITVNAVCPGPVATARIESSLARRAAGADSEEDGPRLASTPVGRIGQPADIARTVLFLADPEADYVTGQAIGVNGGTIV